MKAVVVPKPLHGGQVHTVDIDRDGARVLTGGSDGALCLWNYADLEAMEDPVPQTLTPAMKLQLGSTVTVGRFCPLNPLVVAAGTIDGSVWLIDGDTPECVFPLAKWTSQPVAEGTKEPEPDVSEAGEADEELLENQQKRASSETPQPDDTEAKTHAISTPNIIDVAWSPDGRLVAWISASEVHMHDVSKQTYQTLVAKKTTSSPQSIAFDPTGSYFVCVGDDTVVDVYRYHYKESSYQFKLFTTVSRMANAVPNTVDYRRISWSPDGEYVSVPTASKNQTSLVSLISRSDNWAAKASLVGHDTCCEVVRFNPDIFSWNDMDAKAKLVQNTEPALNVIHAEGLAPVVDHANGTKNGKALSDADSERPHYVYNIIATAGSDMTLTIWNSIKERPLVVLKDIAKKPISDLVWHPNGKSLLQSSMDGHLTLYCFEDQELGSTVDEAVKKQLFEFSGKLVRPFEYIQQVEGATRKPPPPKIIDQKNAVKRAQLIEQNASTDTVPTTESIAIDDEPEAELKPVELAATKPSLTSEHSFSQQTHVTKRQKAAPAPSKVAKPQTQKVTSKDGKKRVQPLLISSNGSIPTLPLQSKGHDMWNNEAPGLPMEYERPSYAVSDSVSRKRLKNEETTKKKRDLEPVKFIGSMVQNPNTAFAAIRLSVPKVRLSFLLEHSAGGVLDIKNGSGNESTPSRVTYFRHEKPMWTDFVPSHIVLATKGKDFWATVTAEGEIYTYRIDSGERLLPPIVLGSSVSFLEGHQQYLLTITSVGEVYVWDLDQKKNVLHAPQSIRALLDLSSKYEDDVLSKAENITMCSVTSQGTPVVTLTNGSGYLFSKDMGVWHIVTESWWAFGSHYWNSLAQNPSSANNEESIIALLEQKTNDEILRKSRTGRAKFMNKISKNMIMKEGFENLENSISINHLENRMLASELLEEKDDFRSFFLTYVKRISELGLCARLLGICSELYGSDDDESWKPIICGWDKRTLLKELVLSCAKYRDVQRILLHYAEKLGVISDMEA